MSCVYSVCDQFRSKHSFFPSRYGALLKKDPNVLNTKTSPVLELNSSLLKGVRRSGCGKKQVRISFSEVEILPKLNS